MALPPHIAVPELINIVVFLSTFNTLPNNIPNKNTKSTEQAVKTIPLEDTSITCCKFIPNPINTTLYCKSGEEYFLNSNGRSIFKNANKIPANKAIGAETKEYIHNNGKSKYKNDSFFLINLNAIQFRLVKVAKDTAFDFSYLRKRITFAPYKTK